MAQTELDRKFDAVFAAITGPGGQVILQGETPGQNIVANFPGTLPLFFKTFCMLNGAVEAVVAGDERLTFATLDALSDRLARGLVKGGIAKGDRVAIAMRNCPSWILAYMGAAKAGAVITLLNGWWQVEELAHALDLTDPKLTFADEGRAKRIAATGTAHPVSTIDIEKPLEKAFENFLELGDQGADLPDVAPEDDATILFTSGSTGLAKGAVSTHRAVTTGVYAYATSLMTLKGILVSEGRPPANPPRTLLNVPLFHVTGEVPVLLNSFVIGRGMVIMPKWDAGEALRLIEKEKITYFVGVPTMSLELMNHPDRTHYDLSSLTDIAAGGAPRPISHVERLQRDFPNSQPALGYGLTETNAVGCGNFWTNYADKPSSTGRAQPGFVDLAILGANDEHLPSGERGEIAIRTAANVRGYWKNVAATDEVFTGDRFVRTGDVGYVDEDGYLFIVDRKKDIIIRGGENISAAEVEAAIYGNHDVAEAAVIGVPDERLGETLMAVLRRRDGSDLSDEALRQFLESRLAAFKIPAIFVFSPDPLPRLGTGKIDRLTLKQQFAQQ
nr:class I adenylate-forming enzyme family protein [uncultured Sphingomonas sp.]